MTELRIFMAHLAACAVLEKVTGSCNEVSAVAEAVEGHRGGWGGQGDKLRESLACYGAQGSMDNAALALSAWHKGPRDLGRLYQLAKKRAEKKELGQVFTPQSAIKGTLDLLPAINPRRICDPACGAGDFLIEAARRWPEAALWGWDIDPLALAVANSRLVLAGFQANLEQADALTLVQDKPKQISSFDLVAGNPPWGGKHTRPHGYSIHAKARTNSFVWFIELAHWLLKDEGQLAMVLPEAWLKVKSYSKTRAWFLQRFSLRSLCYAPKLFSAYYAPAVFVCARKAARQEEVKIWHQPRPGQTAVYYNTLPPEACAHERININYQQEIEDIWQKCQEGAVFLEEGELGLPLNQGRAVVDFSLGIVTGNNKGFVIHSKLSSDYLPLLCADDITPFKVRNPSRWLKYDPNRLQQTAPLAKYQVPAKIVYKFITRNLICAVDRSRALTLNNLNIIVPLRLPFSADYLAALLNSELLGTLYMYRFFTGKVLTSNLKQLPLAVPGAGIDERITQISRGEDREALNDLVYSLYKLGPSQRQVLRNIREKLIDMFFI